MLRVLTWPFRFAWRIRKRLLVALGVLLVLSAVALLIWNPRGAVWGFLRGEKFYEGYAANWWRDRFAKGWEEETLGDDGWMIYWHIEDDFRGGPMLVDFLADPEVRVRRSAAACLWRVARTDSATVPPLVAALNDADPWVRGLAAEALGWRGELAREHFADVLALTTDPDPNVARRAEAGAWGIDPARMAERAGWVTYRCQPGKFTARFPITPTITETVAEDDNWRVRYVRATARTADATLVIEHTDTTRAELKPGGDETADKPQAPHQTEFLTGSRLSGAWVENEVAGKAGAMRVDRPGTSADRNAVGVRNVWRTAPEHPTEPKWDALALDLRTRKAERRSRIEMLRYFVHSLRADDE